MLLHVSLSMTLLQSCDCHAGILVTQIHCKASHGRTGNESATMSCLPCCWAFDQEQVWNNQQMNTDRRSRVAGHQAWTCLRPITGCMYESDTTDCDCQTAIARMQWTVLSAGHMAMQLLTRMEKPLSPDASGTRGLSFRPVRWVSVRLGRSSLSWLRTEEQA